MGGFFGTAFVTNMPFKYNDSCNLGDKGESRESFPFLDQRVVESRDSRIY